MSERRLKIWLGLIENVALAVDEHLRTQHIGNYELISYYHTWDRQYDRGRYNEERAFKEKINQLIGESPSNDYMKEMIEYYSNI